MESLKFGQFLLKSFSGTGSRGKRGGFINGELHLGRVGFGFFFHSKQFLLEK